MKGVNEGCVQLEVTTRPEHADSSGIVHPGVLTSLMDSTIGIALGRLRGGKEQEREGPRAPIEMNSNFHASARPGDTVVAEGRVTRLADRFAFGEAEARLADRGLLARARFTCAIPGRPAS